MTEIEVEVLVQIDAEDVLAGRLWSHRHHSNESATFSYAVDYLTRRDAYELDPSLPLVAGAQQTRTGQSIFAAFSDCSPDRWGRRLVHRRERERARNEQAVERSFGEIDYLLGVRDDLRQGAVRFRDPQTGAYLADIHSGVPHLLDLPRLLNASEHLERDDIDTEDLEILLRGGSSLGGARPKAHVLDRAGRLAIAKFPSVADERRDVIRWEAVALSLAANAGIVTPTWDLHVIDGRGVLIAVRFDRAGARRVGYVSAMTMLEAGDGDGEQGSYLDIVETIEDNSPHATEDLQQLWRRIAFSILISNTDDHLRNHGFVRADSAGWSLSPAFDLNPDPAPGPKFLSTAIDYNSTAARIDTLVYVADYFRLGSEEMRNVLGDVAAAVSDWRTVARRYGLGDTEIEVMAPAFEHEQAGAARAIVT